MQKLLVGKPKPTPEQPRDRRGDREPLIKRSTTPATLTLLMLLMFMVTRGKGVHLPQQPRNVWVMWVNLMGQTDFCLSLQSATSPFRTCLVGLPSYQLEKFRGYMVNYTVCKNDADATSQTASLIQSLNHTLHWDPQELDILGSQMIKNG